MIIDHPLLGPRDSQEFVLLGDASLLTGPTGRPGMPAKPFMNISICGTIRQARIASCGTTRWATAAG